MNLLDAMEGIVRDALAQLEYGMAKLEGLTSERDNYRQALETISRNQTPDTPAEFADDILKGVYRADGRKP